MNMQITAGIKRMALCSLSGARNNDDNGMQAIAEYTRPFQGLKVDGRNSFLKWQTEHFSLLNVKILLVHAQGESKYTQGHAKCLAAGVGCSFWT